MRDGIESIEHCGVLIRECSLDGERTVDKVVPAHPSAIQLSADRWLILYATRMFRGTDDDTSIVYQIRADSPGGKLIKEGMMQPTTNEWEPFGDGRKFVKQHGHPSVFGVPKGAQIRGQPAKTANVFALLWRMVARSYNSQTGLIEGANPDPEMVARTTMTEWVQVRLNDLDDDIEIIDDIRKLRQVGYDEEGAEFCEADEAKYMAQGYTPPVPLNNDCTEWALCNQFDGDRFAALRFRFIEATGTYEWTETGPYLFPGGERLSNASLAPFRDDWVCGVRTDYVINHVKFGTGLKWIRMDDPFSEPPEPVHVVPPRAQVPIVVSFCPDGFLRLFSGDPEQSPSSNPWNPLFCWTIDPDKGFMASNQRVVYDIEAACLPFRRATMPKADMCKPLFHTGNTQILIHRVSLVSNLFEHIHTVPERWVFPPINELELDSCGIYWAEITYREVPPPRWSFS